jgi:PncC family amidohydrolase
VTEPELTGLAARLQAILVPAGRTLATAESCTGGLIAHALTEIAGSSGYFRGGFVTYDNEVKRDQLGVPDALLVAHGAVSAQVARAMAEGARDRLGTDLGVAVTGIAGPDGGTTEKPVGLTYIAVADADGVDVRRYHWTADRSGNKRESAYAALALVLERVGEATDARSAPTSTTVPGTDPNQPA